MLCTIQAQFSARGCRREPRPQLSLGQPDRAGHFWHCEMLGNDQVDIILNHSRQRVSSRTALKMLMRELLLRDALSDYPLRWRG